MFLRVVFTPLPVSCIAFLRVVFAILSKFLPVVFAVLTVSCIKFLPVVFVELLSRCTRTHFASGSKSIRSIGPLVKLGERFRLVASLTVLHYIFKKKLYLIKHNPTLPMVIWNNLQRFLYITANDHPINIQCPVHRVIPVVKDSVILILVYIPLTIECYLESVTFFYTFVMECLLYPPYQPVNKFPGLPPLLYSSCRFS